MPAKPKGGLGRGLSALIPEAKLSSGKEAAHEIELVRIRPRPDQPRNRFNPKALEELVLSIKSQGVLQPLLVTPDGANFTLIAGERRFRAARAAGLFSVPCRVLDHLSERDILEISLIENVQREDLNPVELGHGYQNLIDDLELTQAEVAERVGVDRVTVTNTIRLLRLPAPILLMIEEEELSSGHARALLSLNTDMERMTFATRVVTESMSVRDLERAVKTQEPLTPKSKRGKQMDIHAQEVAMQLEEQIGMNVEVNHRGPHGKLVIKYTSLDELDRLILLLQRGNPPL